jgi:transposase
VNRGLERRRKQPLIAVGVDETSFQKRHEYVTVILDRNKDIVLDVLDVRAHIESAAERELGSRQFPTLRVNRVT